MIKNRNCDFTPAFILPVAADDPATARNLVEGMIYYNSASDKIRKYDGAAWANLEGGSGATTFVGLSDTPANFTSAANKFLRVNAAGNAVEFDTLTGDITIAADGTTAIASGVIVNADIKSDAAIVSSKLALTTGSIMLGTAGVGSALDAKTSGYIMVGDGSTVASVAVSGDVTLAADGEVAVTDLTITSQVQGDILYYNGSNWVRLAPGTSGKYLKTQGAASNPIWDTPSVGSASSLISPFTIEGGTYDPSTSVTTQTSSAAALTIPDLAGVAQEWVFSKKAQTLENKTLTTPIIVTTGSITDAGGAAYLKFVESTTPVNYLQLTNSDTGDGVTLETEGTDSDVDLLLVAKGTGVVKADGVEVATISGTQTLTAKTLTTPKFVDGGYIADSNGLELLVFGVTASAVNEIKISNAATGNGVTLETQGDDAAIDLLLVAKGTGVIKADGVEVVTLSGTQTLTNKTLTSPKLNEDVAITSTATEVNVLDGITATTAELNKLAGTAAGLSSSELDILDGATISTAELNILDGVTASYDELNLLDGASIGVAVASKALVLGSDKNVDTIAIADGGLKLGAGAGTAVTSTAVELNYLDTSSPGSAVASKALVLGAHKNVDELHIADGGLYLGADAGTSVDATAVELNTKTICCRLSDISGANSAFAVSPFAGTLSKVYTVIHGAITTADAIITINVNGGANVTNTITIATVGSAAGIVDSCDPGDNHTVAAGDYLKATSNGGSDTACEATVVFVITL